MYLNSLVETETVQNPHNYLSNFIISPASTKETKLHTLHAHA